MSSMGKKTNYVDTSALIALLDKGDSYHIFFASLFQNPPSLFTTPLVIAEGQAWFLKRYDRYMSLRFLTFIEECTSLKIEPVTKVDVLEANKMIRKFSDQNLTLTDACGLWLMKKHGVTQCWSTDHHLSLTGVPLVIHQ